MRAIHLDQPGRGRALHMVWSASDADVVASMDVDRSIDLAALVPLVAPLLADQADVAAGSRLVPGGHVVRGLKREVISRAYNRLLRATLRVCEIPVDFTDPAGSRVRFVATALADLRGIWRLMTSGMRTVRVRERGTGPFRCTAGRPQSSA